MYLTYRYRIKDAANRAWLKRRATAVNVVWNWCNDVQKHALRHNKKWPSAFDLNNLSAGSSKELGLHAQTVQAVCEQYVGSRREKKLRSLRYRGKKSLGWIPFKAAGVRVADGEVTFLGRKMRFWQSRDLPSGAEIRTGSFAANAEGKWFLNLVIKLPDVEASVVSGELGIDLGLKRLASCSDGEQIDASRFYRDLEPVLAVAQRAGKKRKAAALHRKIANRRRDRNHKATTRIADRNGLIVVGDVSASKFATTPKAKSVLDQGWADFKRMLRYKAMRRGAIFLEVNEALTTQACSVCLACCGPKGLEGLEIREWTCVECGVVHDRDVNAARNILRLGHETLGGGSRISVRRMSKVLQPHGSAC